MFLHEPGDNDESYSRQDLSSINSVSTQRPLPVSTPSTVSASRQAAQAQAPIQQAQPVAAASQPMARDLSKDGSDSGDGSALPSTASWAKGGISVLSRRNSGATSVAASSPAVSHSVPVQDESAGPVEHLSERAAEKAPADTVAPEPEPSESPLPRYDPVILSLLKSIRAMSTCQQNRTAQDPDIVEIASNFPSLLDDQGGLKRRLMREQMEESAQLSEEQDPRDIIRSVEEDQEEAPESGSGQLGGEPEDREERDNQPPGFPDQRRPSAQLPIQRGVNDGGIFGGALGQSFQGLSNLSSINGRTLTPDQQRHLSLLKSTPTGFSESNYPPGMGMPGQSHQGHNRQSSRFSFSGEGGAKIASTQKLGGNPNMMVPQQGNQFNGNSMPGPPPGLKSTGTPPMNGFGQHGFGGLGASAFGGNSREGSNEMLREMIRNRGGMTGGQGHDAGKREFMFPSYPHQYPSSSTPAPASGLLASLYGPQPGAFHDFGLKQKKKGKKHRHANTSSSGGSALVDLADPNSMQSRMALHHAQGNAGVGQGLFGGQAQGGYGQNSMYGAGASGFRW
jgi:CCR4-NOT transcription complex subunit 4